MEENNPLFDLSKIRFELLFLNEKDNPNIKIYENNLIFYLNKYLYKIDMKTQNENNNEKNNSNFIFLEFYTKNLNTKSLKIHETNLLSNKTDFFCNILLILDTKEKAKDKVINILKNINTPKELTYTLIFYDENSDFNLQNNDIINIDKNSYDLIGMNINNNEFNKCIDKFKNCYQYLENALKKMIIKYRIYNLNQKIDISINNKNDEENNEDEKIKNKLDILEIYIKLGNYQKSLEYLNSLKESFVIPKELIIFQECEIIINFLIEYNNKLEYNKKLEDGFLDLIENYKNLRQINLMVNAYLKLLYYLSYFNKNEIKARMNEIINNLLCEKLDEKINKNNLFLIYLNISHIYNIIKLKKKFFIFLFLAYKEYYKNNNNKKIKSQNNLNYFNFFIKNIEKYFFGKNYSSIANYYEYNYNQFLDLSNIIKLSQYKPIKFTFKEEKENSKEEERDIQLAKKHLYINNIYFGYYHIFHMKKWEIIQNKIYKLFQCR